MKKLIIVATVFLSVSFVSCGTDYSSVEATAEYYYNKGRAYHTLDYTVGLSSSDYAEMARINAEENAYINSLSSDERRAYYNKLRELENQ
ncbi:MAG: hypothetical protein E7143_08225 [Rikenellaceae bacterium]|nr:hypothetical protein [Rikenellaceae bacterium]